MANNTAPDSWEQQDDCRDNNTPNQDKSMENKFSTLNVNAAEFIPSFCINSTPQISPAMEVDGEKMDEDNPDSEVPVEEQLGKC